MTDVAAILTLASLASLGIIASAAVLRTRGVWLLIGFWLMAFIVPAYMLADLQGYPKSKSLETARPPVAEVLFSRVIPKKKVYLLLTWKGLPDPKYYWLPWSAKLEKNLTKAKQDAAAHQAPLMVRDPFGDELEGNPPPGGGDSNGAGKGNGGTGRPGSGAGGGADTGDNADSEGGHFYAAPPPPLPDKFLGTP